MRECAGSVAAAVRVPDGFGGDDAGGVVRQAGPALRLIERRGDGASGCELPLGDLEELGELGEAERYRVERELHEARRVETVGRFAVSIAHDFNSLCSALVYFAEVATSCVRSGSDPTAVITHIAETAQSAGELSRQILSFTRDQITEPIRLSIASAVTELTPLLRCLAGPERDLDIVAGGGSATTRIAPSHLRQILLNLLVNAHDATQPGGGISIETGVADGHVTLRVTDTGSGMDARTAERCFEPFFTTKGMGRGTGIGLATVRDLVDGYGGRIDVTSTPGHGSTFTVSLPTA